MIHVSFSSAEWTDIPNLLSGTPPFKHSITAVDFILWNGEKALVIDDSWGRFNQWNGQRVLTETFLKSRLFFAGHLLNLSNHHDPAHPTILKPKYTFSAHLGWNIKPNADVIALQNILKYEGLFPLAQTSTGIFLQITAKAVQQFQIKNGIMDFANVTDLTKVVVGPKTIALLNSKYS